MKISEKFIIRVTDYRLSYDEEYNDISSHFKISKSGKALDGHFNSECASFNNFNIKRK